MTPFIDDRDKEKIAPLPTTGFMLGGHSWESYHRKLRHEAGDFGDCDFGGGGFGEVESEVPPDQKFKITYTQ